MITTIFGLRKVGMRLFYFLKDGISTDDIEAYHNQYHHEPLEGGRGFAVYQPDYVRPPLVGAWSVGGWSNGAPRRVDMSPRESFATCEECAQKIDQFSTGDHPTDPLWPCCSTAIWVKTNYGWFAGEKKCLLTMNGNVDEERWLVYLFLVNVTICAYNRNLRNRFIGKEMCVPGQFTIFPGRSEWECLRPYLAAVTHESLSTRFWDTRPFPIHLLLTSYH